MYSRVSLCACGGGQLDGMRKIFNCGESRAEKKAEKKENLKVVIVRV